MRAPRRPLKGPASCRCGDGNRTPGVLEAITAETAVAALPHWHWTDGTQSLGAMPFTMAEIQPDFLVTTDLRGL